jgi:hypothetical protein
MTSIDVHEFLFVSQPLPIRAAESPINPLAIR